MRKTQSGSILFFVALGIGAISGIAALMGFGNKPLGDAGVTGIDPNPAGTAAVMQSISR